jgi:hypothetical protein
MDAFERLRRGPAIQRILDEHAESWAERARDLSGRQGYQARKGHGATRDRAAVVTTDIVSMEDEARNHTLMRTMPGGT